MQVRFPRTARLWEAAESRAALHHRRLSISSSSTFGGCATALIAAWIVASTLAQAAFGTFFVTAVAGGKGFNDTASVAKLVRNR